MRHTLGSIFAAILAIIVGYGGTVYAWPSGPLAVHPDEPHAIEATVGCAAGYTVEDASHGTRSCGEVPEMLEGIARCADHDASVWHPLVRRDASGAIACTYGHEHHADPNTVNDIFGPPSAWYGGSQEISYPWQTVSQLGPENHAKHEGYKWYVERDQPCRPAWEPPNDGCVIAWRVQVHTLGTAADAIVRFHSYSMEAVVEHHGQRGIVRHGGWLDFGHLALVSRGTPGGHLCPPLPSNPERFSCGSQQERNHSSSNVPAPGVGHNSYLASWYGAHLVTQFSVTFEEWGPIDYQEPARQLFHPPEHSGNNTYGNLGNMSVTTAYDWLAPYRSDGLVTFDGHTDRAGDPVSGCESPGVDCVPLRIEGAPSALYVWNSGIQGGSVHYPDYDVPSPVTGRSLVWFPN